MNPVQMRRFKDQKVIGQIIVCIIYHDAATVSQIWQLSPSQISHKSLDALRSSLWERLPWSCSLPVL